jgi:hypothetical protein
MAQVNHIDVDWVARVKSQTGNDYANFVVEVAGSDQAFPGANFVGARQ